MTLFDQLLDRAATDVNHAGWSTATETAMWQTSLRRSDDHRARVAAAIRRPRSVATVAAWAVEHGDRVVAYELLTTDSDAIGDVDALLELCRDELPVIASEAVTSHVANAAARRLIDTGRVTDLAAAVTNPAVDDPGALADILALAVTAPADHVIANYLASLSSRSGELAGAVAARIDGDTLTALWPRASRRSSADWIVEHYSRHLTERVAGGGDVPDAALLSELADTVRERCVHSSGAAAAASALVDVLGDEQAGPLTDAVAQHSNPSAATRAHWAETLETTDDADKIADIADLAVRCDDRDTLAAVAATNPHTYTQTLDRFADHANADVARTAALIDDPDAAARWFSACVRSRNHALPITTTEFACSQAAFVAAVRTSGVLDGHPVGTPFRVLFGYQPLLAEPDLDPVVLAEVPVGELARHQCPTLWASLVELCGTDAAAVDIADVLVADTDDTTPLGALIAAARDTAEHRPAA